MITRERGSIKEWVEFGEVENVESSQERVLALVMRTCLVIYIEQLTTRGKI